MSSDVSLTSPVVKTVGMSRNSVGSSSPMQASHFRLISATPQETVFEFTAGDVSIHDVEIDGNVYSAISCAGGWQSQVDGAPSLPMYRTELAVPTAGYRIEVLSAVTEEISCKPPVPSAGMPVMGEKLKNPVPDDAIYASGKAYPQRQLTMHTAYKIRDIRRCGVSICPASYDFSRQVLCMTRSMTVRFVSDDAVASDYGCLSDNMDYARVQANGVLNAGILTRSGEDSGTVGRLLVIVPDEWKECMDDYAAWKRHIGFEVVINGYPSDTGEEADGIRKTIADGYAAGVTHVMLVGDVDTLPSAVYTKSYRGCSMDSPKTFLAISDVPYALVSGDDLFMDVFLSRLSVADASELSGVLSKLQSYESSGEAGEWCEKGITIASDETYAEQGKYCPSELRKESDETVMAVARNQVLDSRIWGTALACVSDTPKAELTKALNDGSCAVMYIGHGTNVRWSTLEFENADAKKLTNNAALPFIASFACLTGNFGYSRGACLAETFLRNLTGGACGMLACTNDAYLFPPIYMLRQFTSDMCQAQTPARYRTQGAYCQASINAGILYHETTTAAIPDNSYYAITSIELSAKQFQLFGDSSLAGRFGALKDVSVQAKILSKSPVISVRVADKETGSGVSGAVVCLHAGDNEQSCIVRTGEDGVGLLPMPSGVSVDELSATVYDPLFGVVEIERITGLDVDDDGYIANGELTAFLGATNDGVERAEAIENWRACGGRPVVDQARLEITASSRNTDGDGDRREEGRYETLLSELEEIWTGAYGRCWPEYIGETEQGRKIYGVGLGTRNKSVPRIAVFGGFSGIDGDSCKLLMHLLHCLVDASETPGEIRNLLEKVYVVLIPCVNPDDYDRSEAGTIQGTFPDGVTDAGIGRFAAGAPLRLETCPKGTAALMRWCCEAEVNVSVIVDNDSPAWRIVYPYANNLERTAVDSSCPDAERIRWLAGAYSYGAAFMRVAIRNAALSGTMEGSFGDWLYRVCGTLPLQMPSALGDAKQHENGLKALMAEVANGAFEPLSEELPVTFENKRHIPGEAQRVSRHVSAAENARADIVCSIRVPDTWCAVVIESCPGVVQRWEADGVACSWVIEKGTLTEDIALTIECTPDATPAADGLVTLEIRNDLGQTLEKAVHWLCAEPMTLNGDWKANKLVSLPAAVLEGILGTVWQDGKFVKSVVSTAKYGFAPAQNMAVEDLEGYCPAERVIDVSRGWNLLGVPWCVPAEYFNGTVWGVTNGVYSRAKILRPGKAYWIFSKDKRTIEL